MSRADQEKIDNVWVRITHLRTGKVIIDHPGSIATARSDAAETVAIVGSDPVVLELYDPDTQEVHAVLKFEHGEYKTVIL